MSKTNRFSAEDYDADHEDSKIVRAFPAIESEFALGMDEPSDYLVDGGNLDDYSKALRGRLRRLAKLRKMSHSVGDRSFVAVPESDEPASEDKTDELNHWLAAGESIDSFEQFSQRK